MMEDCNLSYMSGDDHMMQSEEYPSSHEDYRYYSLLLIIIIYSLLHTRKGNWNKLLKQEKVEKAALSHKVISYNLHFIALIMMYRKLHVWLEIFSSQSMVMTECHIKYSE